MGPIATSPPGCAAWLDAEGTGVSWFLGLFAALVLIGLRRSEHALSSHLLVLVVVTTALLGSFFFSLGR